MTQGPSSRSTWPIVFLVYDARSGSTFFAELLMRRLSGVYVTPEIAFSSLLRIAGGRNQQLRHGRLFSRLASDSLIRNLGIGADELQERLASLPVTAPASVLVRRILEAHLDCTAAGTPTCVVVKHGIHVRVWRQIAAAFAADARFIHIYRDPRAVVNSKLRTMRPYHRYEPQAWYGPLLGAWRWRVYSRAMREARARGVAVLDITYEALLEDPETQLREAARFLGVGLRTQAAGPQTTYRIPESEQAIHQLVQSGQVHRERSAAWVTELSSRDLRAIEAVALPEMQARGYRPTRTLSGVRRMATVAAELPRTIQAVAVHAWRCGVRRRLAVSRRVGMHSGAGQ